GRGLGRRCRRPDPPSGAGPGQGRADPGPHPPGGAGLRACRREKRMTGEPMEPIRIGALTLPHKAVFGPMAGFTDAPCRRLMAEHGAGFTVSEMVSSRALTYRDHKTLSLLRPATKGAPYGGQLFGEVPEIMGQAAAMIEGEDFDFLDINMGCPAPKIVSGGAGSKLMLHPELCGEIVAQVKAHTSRPVTVKMRKGWDDEHV